MCQSRSSSGRRELRALSGCVSARRLRELLVLLLPLGLLGALPPVDISNTPAASLTAGSFTIFACPRPFAGSGDPQLRALRSWLALKSVPQVVLLGQDASLHDVAAAHGDRVTVESDVDRDFLGTPQFHSLVARALRARSDFSVFLNSDILLFDDFVEATLRLSERFSGFVATAARWDVLEWPYTLGTGASLFEDAAHRAVLSDDIHAYVRRNGSLHAYGGTDVWVWDNKHMPNGEPLPLHAGVMPPFIYGRGKYDNWLNHEIERTGTRPLVDISTAVTTVHVAHNYMHMSSGGARKVANFWSSSKHSSWQLFANIVLAQSYGTYTNQLGTALHASWKLAACEEAAIGNMCLSRRARPAMCPCEYSSAVAHSDKDPVRKGATVSCGTVSVDLPELFQVSGHVTSTNSTVGLPHTLEQLLPMVADPSGTVVLTGLLGNYGDFLLNFVCQLRKLGVQNVLIAAFDEEAYRISFLHGLPVFLLEAPNSAQKEPNAACHYGTRCFRAATKVKSRATLQVLELGYNVLYSDTDIVWFGNALARVQQLASSTGHLFVQSNEPNATFPANGKRRINSGFYYASATSETIAAFRAIVDHSSKTRLSEQPSFYDVLCDVDGKYTVGDNACQLPNGVRTVFLDRDEYPNGKHRNLWSALDISRAARAVGAQILHNNWAVGTSVKMTRQKKFWHWDEKLRMCQYDWAL